MEASSVSSSSFTPPPQTQASAQSKKAERPEPAEQKPRQQEAARSEEPKRPPVVNTQGQTTGRIINTSA